MAKKVAFVPFRDQEIIDMTQSVVDMFHRGSRFQKTFMDTFDVRIRIYSAQWPVLAGINVNTQVYVFGHGEARATELSGGEAGNALTMPQLAARIRESGLDKAHKHLKLHACRGGEGGSGSMAYNLWKALHDTEDYKSIHVCGYSKYLGSWANKKGSKVGVDADFDDDGNVTAISNETRQKDLRVCWP